MALADITLNDGQGTPVAHTFAYVGTDTTGRVLRRDMSRTPDLPLQLTIGHKDTKIDGQKAASHVVRFDETKMDADGVTARKANIRVMIDCDNAIYSDGLADDLAAYVRNYFSSANTRALMKGSVG